MDILQRIRRAVREQRYRISSHANEEMSEDDLEAKDIECNVLAVEWHGGSHETHAAPAMKLSGTRRMVVGEAWFAALFGPGVLLIITAYAEEE